VLISTQCLSKYVVLYIHSSNKYHQRPNGLRIDRLTDDYTNVTSNTYLWPQHIEAPAIYKKDGVYFMFGSQLTGQCLFFPLRFGLTRLGYRMGYVCRLSNNPLWILPRLTGL
jgi:hypothetical protein